VQIVETRRTPVGEIYAVSLDRGREP
jgi:hypothetical protein